MSRELILAALHKSLEAVTSPRFFQTERGFQGELLVQLNKHLPTDLFASDTIIEQEYQKRRSLHGLSIRPDIIIHEPFNPERHADRSEGNIAVVELKLKATEIEAVADFNNLIAMIEILNYPLAVFINIASSATHSDHIPIEGEDRIVAFAVYMNDGCTTIVRSDT